MQSPIVPPASPAARIDWWRFRFHLPRRREQMLKGGPKWYPLQLSAVTGDKSICMPIPVSGSLCFRYNMVNLCILDICSSLFSRVWVVSAPRAASCPNCLLECLIAPAGMIALKNWRNVCAKCWRCVGSNEVTFNETHFGQRALWRTASSSPSAKKLAMNKTFNWHEIDAVNVESLLSLIIAKPL